MDVLEVLGYVVLILGAIFASSFGFAFLLRDANSRYPKRVPRQRLQAKDPRKD